MSTRTKTLTSVTTLIALLVLLWAVTNVSAHPPAQGPGGDESAGTVANQIHVQGQLYYQGGPAPDGTYSVRFRLYTAAGAAEGDYIWSATQSVTTSRNGRFSTA